MADFPDKPIDINLKVEGTLTVVHRIVFENAPPSLDSLFGAGEPDSDTLALIFAAAAAAAGTQRIRLKSIRPVAPSSATAIWAEQGRVRLHSSHRLR